MTNREMERRYLEMKHTYHTILMANTNLVDDLKDLKNKINDIKELLYKEIEYARFYDDYEKAHFLEIVIDEINRIIGE